MKSPMLSFATRRRILIARKMVRQAFNYSIVFLLFLITSASFLDYLQGI